MAPTDSWTDRLDREHAPRKEPITPQRIVTVALEMIAREGFDAVTMRRVAAAMHTGPASLYAHVRNKAELDELLIGELCTRVTLPDPDSQRWRQQITYVCRQLLDLYLAYPGISRAATAAAPVNLNTLTISEGMLAILLVGGIEPQAAAWAIDAAFLYVGAYALEASIARMPGSDVDARLLERDEIVSRFRSLPESRFPNTVAHAEELTAGAGHERFDFTLDLLFRGLTRP